MDTNEWRNIGSCMYCMYIYYFPINKSYIRLLWVFIRLPYRKLKHSWVLYKNHLLRLYHEISSNSKGMKKWCKELKAVTGGVLLKEVFLKVSQNSRENTCVTASFLIKLQGWACDFIKKETLATGVFLWILRNL